MLCNTYFVSLLMLIFDFWWCWFTLLLFWWQYYQNCHCMFRTDHTIGQPYNHALKIKCMFHVFNKCCWICVHELNWWNKSRSKQHYIQIDIEKTNCFAFIISLNDHYMIHCNDQCKTMSNLSLHWLFCVYHYNQWCNNHLLRR